MGTGASSGKLSVGAQVKASKTAHHSNIHINNTEKNKEAVDLTAHELDVERDLDLARFENQTLKTHYETNGHPINASFDKSDEFPPDKEALFPGDYEPARQAVRQQRFSFFPSMLEDEAFLARLRPRAEGEPPRRRFRIKTSDLDRIQIFIAAEHMVDVCIMANSTSTPGVAALRGDFSAQHQRLRLMPFDFYVSKEITVALRKAILNRELRGDIDLKASRANKEGVVFGKRGEKSVTMQDILICVNDVERQRGRKEKVFVIQIGGKLGPHESRHLMRLALWDEPMGLDVAVNTTFTGGKGRRHVFPVVTAGDPERQDKSTGAELPSFTGSKEYPQGAGPAMFTNSVNEFPFRSGAGFTWSGGMLRVADERALGFMIMDAVAALHGESNHSSAELVDFAFHPGHGKFKVSTLVVYGPYFRSLTRRTGFSKEQSYVFDIAMKRLNAVEGVAVEILHTLKIQDRIERNVYRGHSDLTDISKAWAHQAMRFEFRIDRNMENDLVWDKSHDPIFHEAREVEDSSDSEEQALRDLHDPVLSRLNAIKRATEILQRTLIRHNINMKICLVPVAVLEQNAHLVSACACALFEIRMFFVFFAKSNLD